MYVRVVTMKVLCTRYWKNSKKPTILKINNVYLRNLKEIQYANNVLIITN